MLSHQPSTLTSLGTLAGLFEFHMSASFCHAPIGIALGTRPSPIPVRTIMVGLMATPPISPGSPVGAGTTSCSNSRSAWASARLVSASLSLPGLPSWGSSSSSRLLTLPMYSLSMATVSGAPVVGTSTLPSSISALCISARDSYSSANMRNP